MKQYRVAILGASGAVGQEMMKILAERKFPVGELHLLASARSAGKVVSWQGQDIVVEEATDAAFAGMDIVLGAAENDIAERFAPAIVRSGAVFVDNSSAFRLDPNVPLVVPEINPGDVKLHHGIIANPNCSTTITLTAINALRKLSPIHSMVVSTYQAVSGAGAGGPIELQNEVDALRAGKTYAPKVFAHQIAYNVIPQIGGEQCDGYTSEEMKLQNEGRKILHLPDMNVASRAPACACPSCAATPSPPPCTSCTTSPLTRRARPSPPPPAAASWTISTRCSIPCRSTRRIRISCSSAASAPT